jgi:membrane protein DedA with SNARE-associated domain
MLDFAFTFLERCGIWGLFGATAIEASSIPFPGALFVLLYGFIMQVSAWKLVLIGLVNSLIFSVFTLIPYAVGYQLESFSSKKMGDTKKIKKAQEWFRKYGEWSITLSRPLSVGNYVSYIAGLSKIRPIRFFLFTLMGSFPWNTALLFIGRSSSVEGIQKFLKTMGKFGTITASVVIFAALVWVIIWWYRKKNQNQKENKSGF